MQAQEAPTFSESTATAQSALPSRYAPLNMHCGYFASAFKQADLIARAQYHIGGENLSRYDLLCGTGVSGTLAVSLLAYALGKRFVIVRKPNDGSHSGHLFEGIIATGDRWLFVDDFICSGRTFSRCRDALRDSGMGLNCVGVFSYHDCDGGFDMATIHWAADAGEAARRFDARIGGW